MVKKKEVSIYDLINLSCVTLRLLMSFFCGCVNGKPIQEKKKTRRREKKDRKKKNAQEPANSSNLPAPQASLFTLEGERRLKKKERKRLYRETTRVFCLPLLFSFATIAPSKPTSFCAHLSHSSLSRPARRTPNQRRAGHRRGSASAPRKLACATCCKRSATRQG